VHDYRLQSLSPNDIATHSLSQVSRSISKLYGSVNKMSRQRSNKMNRQSYQSPIRRCFLIKEGGDKVEEDIVLFDYICIPILDYYPIQPTQFSSYYLSSSGYEAKYTINPSTYNYQVLCRPTSKFLCLWWNIVGELLEFHGVTIRSEEAYNHIATRLYAISEVSNISEIIQ